MNLRQFYHKTVRIVCDEDKVWEGFIFSYAIKTASVYPDDNEPDVEAIIMDHKPSGNLIQFVEEEIKTITIID